MAVKDGSLDGIQRRSDERVGSLDCRRRAAGTLVMMATQRQWAQRLNHDAQRVRKGRRTRQSNQAGAERGETQFKCESHVTPRCFVCCTTKSRLLTARKLKRATFTTLHSRLVSKQAVAAREGSDSQRAALAHQPAESTEELQGSVEWKSQPAIHSVPGLSGHDQHPMAATALRCCCLPGVLALGWSMRRSTRLGRTRRQIRRLFGSRCLASYEGTVSAAAFPFALLSL